MNMLPGEHIRWESDPEGIVITNYRVRSQETHWGNQELRSIMLEHITSCRLYRQSHPVLLLLGGLLVIGAIVIAYMQRVAFLASVPGFIGLFLFFAYFVSRSNKIEVASPTLTIFIEVQKRSFDYCSEFVEEVESAINNRFKFVDD